MEPVEMNKCSAVPVQPDLLRIINRLEEEVKDGYEIKNQIGRYVSNIKPMLKECPSDSVPTPAGEGFTGQAFSLLGELGRLNNELRAVRNHLQDIVG